MRRFFINLILFNREFITKYKEHILKEKQMNDSFISNSLNDTFLNNEDSSDKVQIVRNNKKSKTIMASTLFNFGKMKSANIKEIKNIGTLSKFNRKESSSDKFEMDNLNNDTISDLNELEEYYYNENKDNIEDNKSKNTENDNNYSQKIGFSSGIDSAEISLKEIEEEKKDKKEDKKEVKKEVKKEDKKKEDNKKEVKKEAKKEMKGENKKIVKKEQIKKEVKKK
jgi:hypothetical protein